MTSTRKLPRKPLAEAIFEAHWLLKPGDAPEMQRDPHYKFLLGSLFSAVKEKYPHYEELPIASVPEEMAPHMVQHRFRSKPGGWPLIQLGPGVFTVNETEGYDWEVFERSINDGIHLLIDVYPVRQDLKFDVLTLRYINAVIIDPERDDLLNFLATKMGTSFSFPARIFERGIVRPKPLDITSQFVFPCDKPRGFLLLKFGMGRRAERPALVFELLFMSKKGDIPPMPDGFAEWARAAHGVVEDTFFELIAGDLEKEFSRA